MSTQSEWREVRQRRGKWPLSRHFHGPTADETASRHDHDFGRLGTDSAPVSVANDYFNPTVSTGSGCCGRSRREDSLSDGSRTLPQACSAAWKAVSSTRRTATDYRHRGFDVPCALHRECQRRVVRGFRYDQDGLHVIEGRKRTASGRARDSSLGPSSCLDERGAARWPKRTPRIAESSSSPSLRC
jgi:hypothetical protein